MGRAPVRQHTPKSWARNTQGKGACTPTKARGKVTKQGRPDAPRTAHNATGVAMAQERHEATHATEQATHDATEGNAENHSAAAQAAVTPVGGLGVDVLGKARRREESDTRILARALRERWPLSPEIRKDAIQRLHAIVKDGETSHRDLIMAVKALIDADKVNVDANRDAAPSGGVTLHVQTVVVDGHTPRTTTRTIDASRQAGPEGGRQLVPPTPLESEGEVEVSPPA